MLLSRNRLPKRFYEVNKYLLTKANDKAPKEERIYQMKVNVLKKAITASALSLFVLLGASQIANAQINRQEQREMQKAVKKERQLQQRQVKIEDRRIKSDQRQEQTRIRNMPTRNIIPENNRYRVLRDGNYYQTDNRGANLLRQAVNSGYQEGYRAGRNDRHSRRAGSYANSQVYRQGNFGYQNYVNSGQYQYYFQQGFQRGYEDGFNSRYEYGNNNNGSFNISANISSGILSFEQF
jgi:flagellar biosynthesis/type III secretory pathway protein FliH